MEDILKEFLKKGAELLEHTSLAPITPPQEDLDPLTPPAVFIIHWAASNGEMIESKDILKTYKSGTTTAETITELRRLLGKELLPSHFTPKIRPFLQKYYRAGWTHNYRDDFFNIFQELVDLNDVFTLEYTDDNFKRIEPCLDSRLNEWTS
jgi:hypothetical protein